MTSFCTFFPQHSIVWCTKKCHFLYHGEDITVPKSGNTASQIRDSDRNKPTVSQDGNAYTFTEEKKLPFRRKDTTWKYIHHTKWKSNIIITYLNKHLRYTGM